MAEKTGIEWTDSTFNPWWGCTKISPACDHCYAADLDKRTGGNHWGNVPRRRTSEKNWNEPRRWQKSAAQFMAEHGRKRRVFCASMADVFDNQVPTEWRDDLWALIRDCPDLDWLLLTKRPQNIAKMLPAFWGEVKGHVWLGTTVEDQERADQNIPHLLRHDCAVRFVSCEPVLGPIDLRQWMAEWGCACGYGGNETLDHCPNCGWVGEGPSIDGNVPGDCPSCNSPLSDYYARPECEGTGQDGSGFGQNSAFLSWVIAGGESGPHARVADPAWFRSLRDQCAAAGIPFLFKQWGEWVDVDSLPAEIVEHFDVQGLTADGVVRIGKKRAGRALDGVLHDGYPGAK